MICPKCGRPVDENAVICRGCDFILDTEFLGDGILDEEHTLRPGAGGVDPAAFNLADAVILGNIDDDSQSFETSDSGFHMQANMHARLYVSGRSQALMSPDAVPALAQSGDGLRLTPFERHVLAFIDGKKPVEVIRRAAGLDEAEVKTALATLADKGIVKVIGRALADFDPGVETMPRRPPQRHRMRGSAVGAVALVGDEADKAIDEAFRTQVALVPILAANLNVADGDVFKPARASRETHGGGDSELPSDADQFVGLKGTDEIEKRRLEPNTSSTVRPSAQKAAVNRAGSGKILPSLDDSQDGIDASAEASAVERSIVDKSDGFDDFGQPSDVSTAVVAQDFSESSSPGGPATGTSARMNPNRPPSGVFADISAGDISDIDQDEIQSVQNLADSRVQPRPKLASAPKPQLASEGESGSAEVASADAAGFEELPSVEIERNAASGEVWGSRPANEPRATRPPTNPRGSLSSSLSDLLSDQADAEEPTANVPPERAAAMVAEGRRRRAAAQAEPSSFEEPTAAGQPMPPLPLPRIGTGRAADAGSQKRPAMTAKPPAPPAAQVARVAPPAEQTSSRKQQRVSAMVSMPEGQAPPDPLDESSGLHAVDKNRRTGAASEIFDDPSESPPTAPREPPPAIAAPRPGTGRAAPVRPPPRPPDPSVASIEAASVQDGGDETVPPSQEPPIGDESSEILVRPEASDDRSVPVESVASESAASDLSADRSAPDRSEDSSSVEMVDSGLVIRPAAKAVPLAIAAKAARGGKPARAGMVSAEGSASSGRSGPRPSPSASSEGRREPLPDPSFAEELEENLVDDEIPENEDSEDTVNLDLEAQRKRLGKEAAVIAGGRPGGVAAIPSGFSQVVAAQDLPQAKVTDENRRKARKLFEEAQKEASEGRMGAARMNAKLASIYDPANAMYREQLEEWERPPTNPKPRAAPTSRSTSKASDESQAEIKALYDEAQRFEDEGDIDEALDLLEAGVERFPQAAAFHNRIGVILAMKKRDYEGAVQAIQRAIDIDPENLHYKSNLGKIVAKMRGARADA